MRKPVRLALVSAAVLLLAEEELKNPIVKPRLSAAVLGPRFSSPWTRFWRTGMDSDFIYTMGLDRAAFKVLLRDFKHFYDNYEIATLKKLKPSKFTHHGNRALDAAGALALVLHWLNSKAEDKYLCFIFAITEGTFAKYKRFGLFFLHKTLKRREDAQVRWPTHEQQQELAELVSGREPALKGVWGFIDGLNLRIYNPPGMLEQNACYNGWLGATFCSSLFIWQANGLIAYYCGNCPGSWHDGAIAHEGAYQRLNEGCRGSMCVASDSAFSKPRGCPHIMRVDKEGDEEAVPHDERWMHSQMQAALVSCRQAVEWGMGTFQKSFKRLTFKLTNMPKKRALILALCVRLQQFRTRNVGLNQIRTVFGHLDEDKNDPGLENIYGACPF